jgi:hypothetical protein
MLQNDAAINGPPPWAGPGPWHGGWGGGWGWSRWGYWSPWREWRRVIVFACLAAGFGVASSFSDEWGAGHAFLTVSVIMGVLAAGALLMAVLGTLMMRPPPPHDR